MADTLSEIYNDTLVESDFNSSGEATIITTDSSTAHVIKNVNVVDVDSNIPINGTLDINGFDIVGLTANSTGSEIVGASSTVKVKTSAFPLSYVDDAFILQSSSTQYTSVANASVNNYVAIEGITTTANNLSLTMTLDDVRRVIAPNVGPSGNTYVYTSNLDQFTAAYVYNSSGTQIYSHTSQYHPKWWDGERYAYYYTQGFPAGINRIDTWNGTSALFKSHSSTSPSTYARMFGIKDKYLFFWPNYALNFCYVYDFATDTISQLTAGTASANFSNLDENFYAVEASNGTVYIITPYAGDTFRYFEWTSGTVLNGPNSTIVTSTNNERFAAFRQSHETNGSEYFFVDDNNDLASWNFETGTPVYKSYSSGNVYTTQAYGRDITRVVTTPSSATISGRSYGINPSLKLRMTGVTST